MNTKIIHKIFEIHSDRLLQLKTIFCYGEVVTKLEWNEKVW